MKKQFIDKTTYQIFEKQVELTPYHIALISDEGELTYSDLNNAANQLAHYLIKSGVKIEEPVGIFMERSAQMVIVIMGVLKSGGVCVLLDLAEPMERLSNIINDTSMSMVLVNGESKDQFLIHHEVRVINLDNKKDVIACEPEQNVDIAHHAEHLAFLVYTSGSTGNPKGVMIPHRVFSRCEFWAKQVFSFAKNDRFLFKSARAPEEFFFPLFIGASLIVAPSRAEYDAALLIQLMVKHQITTVNFSPSLLTLLLDEIKPEDVFCLKHVFCAGEILSAELKNRFFSCLSANLYNFYGLAEAPYTTFKQCFSEDSPDILIGKPIDADIYILDSTLKPVPDGDEGELCVSGPGLSHGYLNQPEMTAARFVDLPKIQVNITDNVVIHHSNQQRIFRTGDRVRYDKEKGVIFLGRLDSQVKIRGFRVELPEVETALNRHPFIHSAAVIKKETQLVAYLVLQPDSSLSLKTVYDFLNKKLPKYSIPSRFYFIDRLPLTLTGKIDRKSLEKLEKIPDIALTRKNDYVSFRNPLEEQITQIWQTVLSVNSTDEVIGIDDNFFELGGHSLLAMQIVSRIRRELHLELSVRDLFEAPTIAMLSAHLTFRHDVSNVGKEVCNQHITAVNHYQCPIHIITRPSFLPLSFSQERLWFMHEMVPNSTAYHVPLAFLLSGELDVSLFEYSLQAVIERHEILRTHFKLHQGKPIQVIVSESEKKISCIDLKNAHSSELIHEIMNNLQYPFDLSSGSLMHIKLIRVAQNQSILLFNIHHIIVDDWSFHVLFQEISFFYEAFKNKKSLPALTLQYADYTLWQQQWLQGEIYQQQLAYWRQKLHEVPLLDIPLDRPRPITSTYQGKSHLFTFSKETTEKLRALAHQENTTFFMMLLSVFYVLLYRYSGQDDICIGTPVTERSQPVLENLIGCFINMLVLRENLSGNPSFREVLQNVRENVLNAILNQDVPFEKLVEELNPERDLSRHPFFQIIFVFNSSPEYTFILPELKISRYDLPIISTRFDLEMNLSITNDRLTGTLTYNVDLFETETIERMAMHYQILLEEMIKNPDHCIASANMLTNKEYQRLLEWSKPFPLFQDVCLHELFEKQVAKTPESIALVFEEQEFTYQQINLWANQLAHELHLTGIESDDAVGICSERSPEMIVGLLAILKAGGAYVPINLDYPEERIRFILEDATVKTVLVQPHLIKRFSFFKKVNFVSLNEINPEKINNLYSKQLDFRRGASKADEGVYNQYMTEVDAACNKAENSSAQSIFLKKTSSRNAAYILYTSGTTGQPKGVVIEHHNVVSLMHWAHETFSTEELSGVLVSTSIGFDVSVFEIFSPLCAGGKIILAQNILQLPVLPASSQVKLISTVPSVMKELIQFGNLPSSVITVCLAGEPLKKSLIQQIYHYEFIQRVYNLYGPTETTVFATFALCQPDGMETIGHPLSTTHVHILDKNQQLLPVGIPGELYISGCGVGRGYLNRPTLTKEKFFFKKCMDKAETYYKTGDFGRYLPDGNIQYLGRMDYQIKLRGFRIELGEIESILQKHPNVLQCVVDIRKDKASSQHLTAYIVLNDENIPLNSEKWREFLKKHLSSYMIPDFFVPLKKIPLTMTGKQDRSLLPDPVFEYEKTQKKNTKPRTSFEQILQNICKEVLQISFIGIHDNFFELGGHSLKAFQLLGKIKEITGISLSVLEFFRNPTIAGISMAVSSKTATYSSVIIDDFIIPLQKKGSKLPLFIIPGGWGEENEMLRFLSMLPHLDTDRPFYAIRSRMLDLNWKIPDTLREQAEAVFKVIRKIQPQGPYHFLSECIGVSLSLELLRVAENQKEGFGTVIFMDGLSVPRKKFFRFFRKKIINNSDEAYQNLPPSVEKYYHLLTSYEAKRRKFKSNLHLLFSSDMRETDLVLNNWNLLFRKNPCFYHVKGNHETFTREENAETIKILREILQKLC